MPLRKKKRAAPKKAAKKTAGKTAARKKVVKKKAATKKAAPKKKAAKGAATKKKAVPKKAASRKKAAAKKKAAPRKAAPKKKAVKKAAVKKTAKKKAAPKKAAPAKAAARKKAAPKKKTAGEVGPRKEEARFKALRKLLLEKREQIARETQEEISKYIKGENRQLVESALDDGDWSVIDLSEDINLRKLATHRETLLKIDESLRKINEGTYGVCEDCGEEIPTDRLRVLPFAIYCRDCQENREELEAAQEIRGI